MGGLAALFASNALRRIDDLNRRLGDNDEDLSALQARIGILENILQRRLTMPSPTMNITGR